LAFRYVFFGPTVGHEADDEIDGNTPAASHRLAGQRRCVENDARGAAIFVCAGGLGHARFFIIEALAVFLTPAAGRDRVRAMISSVVRPLVGVPHMRAKRPGLIGRSSTCCGV